MSWLPAWDKAKSSIKVDRLVIVRCDIEDNLLLTPQPITCRLQQPLADTCSLVLWQDIDRLYPVLRPFFFRQAKAYNMFRFPGNPEVNQGIAIDPLLLCLSSLDRYFRTLVKSGLDVLFRNAELGVGIRGKPGVLLNLP